MFIYWGKRFLWLVVSYLVLTLFGFGIMLSAPGDPVLYRMGKGSSNTETQSQHGINRNEYHRIRTDMGLDLPIFYCSILPSSVPDTLHKINSPKERSSFEQMCMENGNTERIEQYRNRIKAVIYTLEMDTLKQYSNVVLAFNQLLERTDEKVFSELLQQINKIEDPFIRSRGIKVVHSLLLDRQQLDLQPQKYRTLIPKFLWHGTKNQYHLWLKGWFTGDWGVSYQDNKPVRLKINEAWQWTFTLNIISLSLISLIALPLGISLVKRNNHSIESVLMLFYSLPSFWIATLMLIFLCGGDYWAWFPSGGVQDLFYDENWSWWRKLSNRAWHLVLPVFALSLGSIAYLTRQTRINLQNEMQADYIRTAFAKGLSQHKTIQIHAFSNASLPLIHWLGNSIPALVGGGLLVETIFSIPGMGMLLYEAVASRDYPTVIGIFNLTVLATLIGQLLADVLYYYFDPRIRFSTHSK